MDNVELVEVFNSCNDLMEEFASLWFLDTLVFDDVVKEFTPTCILHD
jgi:hypothetical protein